jgi:quercetin dioxygenase-like cupin family protein
MAFQLRVVVTDHDANGRAIVGQDRIITAIDNKRETPGEAKNVGDAFIWETYSMPAEVASPIPRETPGRLGPGPSGSILRVLEFPDGLELGLHATDSVDYLIVLQGEIDMVLDDGARVHVKAGDVIIQRATLHGWSNRSGKPCRIAFILVDARPVVRRHEERSVRNRTG